jgi:hypothetical protein
MVEPRYVVKALDQSRWAAFAELVERNNGIFGGCWCMGFHPEQSWPGDVQERVPQKRAAKEQRVREGRAHAALGRGIPGAGRLGARGLPLPRCLVDL